MESRFVEKAAKEAAKEKLRKTGIDIIGDVSWGMHLCVFYNSKKDLIDIVASYFKNGLENNELCMWIIPETLKAEEAKAVLKEFIKNLDDYIDKGRIEILDHRQWYMKSGAFKADKILRGWVEKENYALKRGFDGLRVIGTASWLEKNDWKKLIDYEKTVNNIIGKHRMLAICAYSLDKCHADEIIEAADNHHFVLIKREDKWVILESSEHELVEEALRISERKYQAILNQAFQFIGLMAPDGTLVEANETAVKFAGVKKSEVYGKPFWETPWWNHSAEMQDKLRNAIKKAAQGEFVRFEATHRAAADGNIHYIDFSLKPIKDEHGKVEFLIPEGRDITELKKTEKALKESESMLREQKLALEQKNLALQEIIEHIERTKNKIKENITINVDKILMPILEKLKRNGASPKYVKLLQYHLKELSSLFGRRITQKITGLTTREIEICTMVKGCLASKDISELLNLSRQTIEKHRKNVRKKLGLSNKKTNLASYLQKI